MRMALSQSKTRSRSTPKAIARLAMWSAAGFILSGCASGQGGRDRLADYEPRPTDAWVWTQPDRYVFQPDATTNQSASTNHNASIAVFSSVAPRGSLASSRRDDLLGAQEVDALPNRLAWPLASGPDLRRQRTFRGSTTAERWVFPSTTRDGQAGRRSYNFRSGY